MQRAVLFFYGVREVTAKALQLLLVTRPLRPVTVGARMVQMPSSFFSLPLHCALRERECDGGGGLYAEQLLLFTHILRPSGALCCLVF